MFHVFMSLTAAVCHPAPPALACCPCSDLLNWFICCLPAAQRPQSVGNKSSPQKFGQGGGEVEHQRGGAAVGLGEGHAEAEGFHAQAGANRESGKEVAVVGRHVGAGPVVVSQGEVDVVARQHLNAEHKVAQQRAAELVLLDKVAVGVVAVGRLVIG